MSQDSPSLSLPLPLPARCLLHPSPPTPHPRLWSDRRRRAVTKRQDKINRHTAGDELSGARGCAGEGGRLQRRKGSERRGALAGEGGGWTSDQHDRRPPLHLGRDLWCAGVVRARFHVVGPSSHLAVDDLTRGPGRPGVKKCPKAVTRVRPLPVYASAFIKLSREASGRPAASPSVPLTAGERVPECGISWLHLA